MDEGLRNVPAPASTASLAFFARRSCVGRGGDADMRTSERGVSCRVDTACRLQRVQRIRTATAATTSHAFRHIPQGCHR